eukprot:Awhi_evm1s3400
MLIINNIFSGYGVYDMYDLGEFDQCGTTKTKYGTKDEYLKAIQTAHKHNIRIYGDVVLNHRMGGDEAEETKATPIDMNDRTQPRGDLQDVKVWTKFTFPGRNGKYSDFQWNWTHFDAVDYNENHKGDETFIWLFEGKNFDQQVDDENENYDYLMGCDLDFGNEEVKKEVKNWTNWYVEFTGVDGFRFDAVKHIEAPFFRELMDAVNEKQGKELFAVGEYWSQELPALKNFIDTTDMSLFDAPLHYNFSNASKEGAEYDMRKIFDDSLVAENPMKAVTLVANHDSQALQALESVVEPWFKPIAYSLILLRRGGYPCIFHPDYYGTTYKDVGKDGEECEVIMPSHKVLLDVFLKARRDFSHGEQYDYFDDTNIIGWTRQGTEENPKGCAVLLSNGEGGKKHMQLADNKNTTFIDATGHCDVPITTDDDGWAEFETIGGNVSVWVPEKLWNEE